MTGLFDVQIALLTLKNVAVLLFFIALGYLLRRTKKVGDGAPGVVSALTAFIFLPAYNFSHLSKTFTMDMLRSNLFLILISTVFCVLIILLGRLLGFFMGKTPFEKKSLYYIFAFSNTGFFGYPVIQGVFGDEVLARFIIFCIPVSLIGNFYAYGLFSAKGGFDVKKALFAMVNIANFAGCLVGLIGVSLPAFAASALSSAGACMSPSAMILAGLVLGAYPLKELVCHGKPYLASTVRLCLIPLISVPVFYLVGLRGEAFFFCSLTSCLPVGLNCVVYPEANGFDASANAKVAFVSFVMSLLFLPLTFSVIRVLTVL